MQSFVSISVDLPCFVVPANLFAGPTGPYAHAEHGNYKYVGYTGAYNLLDYSCVSFPCGLKVDKSVDLYPGDFKPQTEYDTVCHSDCKSLAPMANCSIANECQ